MLNEIEARALALKFATEEAKENGAQTVEIDSRGNVLVQGNTIENFGNAYEPRKSLNGDFWIVYVSDGWNVNCYYVSETESREDEAEGEASGYLYGIEG